MSLHKFAEQVASQGRGDDSLLVHMTPDEVRNLQKFAQANGTTLTINPTTGLPEAGLLSDLFKSIAPIALGAFLGPAGAAIGGGFMSAGMAGLAVGGITTLATGSLSRGLMAGLGAYGGSGLADSFMNAGSASLASSAGATAGAEATQQGLSEALRARAIDDAAISQGFSEATGKTAASDVFGVGAKSAMANPMAFAKQNLGNLAYAAAPIAAGLMVPTTTKLGDPKDTGYIRQFDYNINPDTGKPDPLYGMRAMTPVKASEFKDKTFQGQRDLFRQQNPNPYALGVGSLNQPPQQQQQTTPMATGGIVALARGGVPRYDGKDGSVVGGDAALAAYQSGNYGEASRLLAEAGMNAQDVVSKYGLSQADAAAVAQNLGYKGDMGNIQYAAPPAAQAQTQTAVTTPTYTQYTEDQMGSFLSNPVNKDIDLGKAIKDSNADPAAVNKYIASLTSPFVGSTDTTGGSGTLGIYNNMIARGIDPTEYYNAAIANDPKYAGWTKEMLQRGYNLDKGAYALTAQIEKDKIAADPKLGYDKQWVKFMDTNGYTIDDMAQAFGISKNDIAARVQRVRDAEKKVTTTQGGTGGVSNGVIPGGFYGNATNPGDITTNPDGTVTVHPNIPYRPPGGFSGIGEVSDAYTKGGGSLGYTAPVPKTPAEHNAAFNKMTDDSLDAYNFLMGKGKNLTQRKAETRDRPVMQRYDEAVLGRKAAKLTKPGTTTTKTVIGTPGQPQTYFNEAEYLAANPDVAAEIKTGKSVSGQPTQFTSGYEHYLMYGKAGGRAFTGDYEGYLTAAALANAANAGGGGGPGNSTTPGPDSSPDAASPANSPAGEAVAKEGGMMGYAMGGGLGSLGSYSDGGRLLKGPGDGVSDSIPATIGAKQQPARLADGEFVIPARIVSELGNGSTDAGAKKLYAMMDRVQRARGKTTGKNKVAANPRADKYLPA